MRRKNGDEHDKVQSTGSNTGRRLGLFTTNTADAIEDKMRTLRGETSEPGQESGVGVWCRTL